MKLISLREIEVAFRISGSGIITDQMRASVIAELRAARQLANDATCLSPVNEKRTPRTLVVAHTKDGYVYECGECYVCSVNALGLVTETKGGGE